MSKYARNQDSSHRTVVNALRALGCSVETHTNGTPGAPDIIVGNFGIDVWAEIKPVTNVRARRDPRPSQEAWHAAWKGRRPVVLRTVEDCVALVAQLRGMLTRSEVSQ